MRLRPIAFFLILLCSTSSGASEETAAADAEPASETPATEPVAAEEPLSPLSEPRWERYNRQLVKRPLRGELVWLDDTQQVPALYRPEATGQPQGAVLLLPDMGHHARWPGMQEALREQLPWSGWHSLSIALPPLKPERPVNKAADEPAVPTPQTSETETETASESTETSPAAADAAWASAHQLHQPLAPTDTLAERQQQLFALLDRARAELKARNIVNQAVIAEGEALWWITAWLEARQPEEFGALIMRSPKKPPFAEAPDFADLLEKLQIPQQLDLIEDPQAALTASRQREAAARRSGQHYQRLNIAGLNAEQKAKRLRSWLNRNLAGMEKAFR